MFLRTEQEQAPKRVNQRPPEILRIVFPTWRRNGFKSSRKTLVVPKKPLRDREILKEVMV